METLAKILQLVFYIIWIPIGVITLAGIILLIVNNPLKNLPFAPAGPADDPFGSGRSFGPSLGQDIPQGQSNLNPTNGQNEFGQPGGPASSSQKSSHE